MDDSVALERIRRIRERFPEKGLFAHKEWLISPQPFLISPQFAEELERLGHWLLKFVRSSNLLYHLSVKGKQPPWISDYLDAGKPARTSWSFQGSFGTKFRKVIRPDIILTDWWVRDFRTRFCTRRHWSDRVVKSNLSRTRL